jgi:hypothetical protein
MGPSLPSQNDIELAHLDETPDSCNPRDTHDSHNDDYDSDNDEDDGEHALLGGTSQTRWRQKAQSTAIKFVGQTYRIIAEVSYLSLVILQPPTWKP